MRLPRLPRMRIKLPVLSSCGRSNAWAGGVMMATILAIFWNTHAKPAGAYRGAVGPSMADANLSDLATTKPQVSGTNSDATPASIGPKIDGKLAIRLKQSLLLDAKARLQTIPDYLVTFVRQERVSNSLLNRETIEMKVRHSPFQVYMKWMDGGDIGREVLYRAGENDGKMIVSPASMIPVVKLLPDCDIAMRQCRHPVSQAGLLNLVDKLLEICDRDLKLDEGVSCQLLPDRKFEGRNCYVLRTDYGCAEIDSVYRTCVMFLDRENGIPVCVKNYGWSQACGAPESANDELTDSTLVELYAFSGFRFQSRLAEKEFDVANKEYRFRR